MSNSSIFLNSFAKYDKRVIPISKAYKEEVDARKEADIIKELNKMEVGEHAEQAKVED